MMRLGALSLLVLALSPAAAVAQDAALWGELGLPGGIRAARAVAGLGEAERPGDASLLLDFIRRHAATGTERPAEDLTRYLRSVDAIMAAVGEVPSGIALPTTSDSRERQRVERVLRTLGLDLRRRGQQYEAADDGGQAGAERRAWLSLLGVDPAKLIADLNFGLTVGIDLGETAVPLPLPDYWRAEAFGRDQIPVLTILADRSRLLMYHGLMAADRETLAFLHGERRLLERLRGDLSARFATFGGSLRVADGVVQLPGGDDAIPVWTGLVRRRPQDAGSFLIELLSHQDGRLAYFFDSVHRLDAERRGFVLGSHLTGPERINFVRRVFNAFGAVAPEWKIDIRPFDRPALDGLLPLLTVDVHPDGTLGPDWWPSVLERVSGSNDWPTSAQDSERNIRVRPADAAWMLEWLFQSPSDAVRRYRLLRFAQRHLSSMDRGALHQFELGLRMFLEMPALALALERMGVADFILFGELANSARRLTRTGSPGEALPRIGRWQTNLGLLEQIDRRIRLTNDQRAALLRALVLAADASPGAAAKWLYEHLLPAMDLEPNDDGDMEERFLRAASIDPGEKQVVTWEGLSYSVATTSAAARDAVAIRQFSRGPRLDDLIALHRLREPFEAGPESLEEVREIEKALAELQPAVAALPAEDGRSPAIVRRFESALRNVQRITRANDVRRVSQEFPTLLDTIDAVTGAVVPALLYALAVTPTSQPAVYPEAWQRHRLRATYATTAMSAEAPWRETAWQVPAMGDGDARGGLVGAYLILDVALAEARLVRLPSPDPPVVSAMTTADRLPVVQAVALAESGRFETDAAVGAAAAIARGRSQVAAWLARPPEEALVAHSLSGAGVDPWRINLTSWSLRLGRPGAIVPLTLAELHRLGGGEDLPAGWSSGGMAVDGCVCLIAPRRIGPEDLRGRRVGLQALAPQDLPLRLAEILAELGLQAPLVPLLLPLATQDWLDRAEPAFADDWEAVALWPRLLDRNRVEDYLLHLIAAGHLEATAGGRE